MQQLKINSLLQGGKYKIEKVLGQGGFGITYLASQELLDRKVCIKEFFYKEYCERDEATSHVTLGTQSTREMVERLMTKFIKEARTISQLDHRNIIKIHDIFKENNTAYYVMDYVEGESLNDMVNRRGALPEKEAVSYIERVADALKYIHQHNINHLDIKPSNIMIRQGDYRVILIDFGLSKQYDAQGGQTSTTPVGISHGYAPMEQYKQGGVSAFSPQTDIYALGATLYKLVTGNTPPQAMDILDEGLPSLPTSLSSSVVETIKRAMQPRKVDRPNSIDEFLKDLNVSTQNTDTVQDDVKVQYKQSENEATMILNQPENKERKQLSEYVDDRSKPTISFEPTEKQKEKFSWKWFIAPFLVFVITSYFWNDSEKSEETDHVTKVIEMKQQLINDSIAAARMKEIEKKRIDSINAIEEQARLAEIRKQEEKKRSEETPEELYSKGLRLYNNSQIPIKKKAIPLFEKAAKEGHVKSMYYLGEWYTWAGGNKDNGVMWWEKAADKGSFDAMYKLGRLYLSGGIGLHSLNSTDKERGYRWLEKAASNGHLEAQTFLGECYFMEGLDTNALYWWQKAAGKGYAQAYQELGNYYRGVIRGKVIDYNKAIEWYEKAANVKTSEGRAARSILVNIYYKKEEYRNLNKAKYWCQVMIADGCRHQIENEILDYFGL
ncbi:serine/threonine-protein kinase [Bacteroides sp. AN502(2024)]|uniref:serine/threonine-protein kinase n=1 Tax=Bacteroides sp. AN502(2024) TaxID=3160599 RepID=UPI0035119565